MPLLPARPRHPRPAPPSLPPRAEADASVLNRLVFHWLHPLIARGARQPLQHPDLPPLLPADQAATLAPVFNAAYRRVAIADLARHHQRPRHTPPRKRRRPHPSPHQNHHPNSTPIPIPNFPPTDPDITPSAPIPHPDSSPPPSTLMRLAELIPPRFASRSVRALIPVTFRPFLLAACLKPVWLAAAIAQAFAIRALVDRVTSHASDAHHSSRWAFIPVVLALTFAALVMSLSAHNIYARTVRSGMRASAALQAEIYRKMLRLSPASLAKTSEGEMGNLLVNDTQRMVDAFTYFHFCWFGFIEIAVIAIILTFHLGVSALFGVAILILLVPAQIWFSILVCRARTRITKEADLRVQTMGEVLSGIRTIKLSAWESHFMKVITALRGREVRHLKVQATVSALNSALFFAAPLIVTLATFTAYTLVSRRPLTPSVVFSTLSYFSTLSHVLSHMPLGWLSASETVVSGRRFDAFFNLPELPTSSKLMRLDVSTLENSTSVDCDAQSGTELISGYETTESIPSRAPDGARIWMQHAQFSYAQPEMGESRDFATVLTDINLTVSDADLVCIVGPVGSGKSSLLLGILDEVLCTSGRVHRNGRVAYCAQQPWIVNGTLRENIVMFGADKGSFDNERYEAVVAACCLETDINLLPAGDSTEIGERGVNLSGGQKARVALARAVYSDADLYVFDDPLSAVDSSVSAGLIQKVFGPDGLLSDKAQVVVTHQLKLLPYSSKVLVLGGGTIEQCGTFKDLRARGVEFSGFSGLEDDLDRERSAAARDCEDLDDNCDLGRSEESRLQQILSDANVDVGMSEITKGNTGSGCRSEKNGSKSDVDADSNPGIQFVIDRQETSLKSQGGLVSDEDRNVGRVTGKVYKAYVKAGGGYLALFGIVMAFVLAQGVRQVAEWWLAEWSTLDSRLSNGNEDTFFTENRYYSLVFFGVAATTAILTLLRACLFAERTIFASKRLHNRLLDRVLHATPSFFDTNPMGRILNRFSKDVDQMDSMLPMTAQDCLQIFFVALGALTTISVILPWFLIPLVPIICMFMYLQHLYKKSSRELKRLDGVSRSPVYAQFVETNVGLATVRAHRSQDQFSFQFNGRVDGNHCAFHMFASAGHWLGVRLDALAAMVVFCTSLVVLILSPSLDAGLAGVALTQSTLITGAFQWGVRQAAETENNFTSVERVNEMATETPTEKYYEMPEKQPPADWPSEGRISFKNVTLRYRPELDPALHSLSFECNSHERVGIVGRTGSGKSSLFVSLFRMVELSEGAVFIDGIDISQIGLRDLRSRMAIVPQDPVLFNGTIRSNLDPAGLYNDAQLWDALHRVHMRNAIAGISGSMGDECHGLDLVVHEKGSNFSAGERQLLSLARAILSGVKVVVLDEASASLDNHTDMLVQKTVREQLSDRTVLTIAHRLATIADSDRVLVVDAGEVVEFDTPSKLLDSGGYFAKLVEETGRIESALLKAIIAEASGSGKKSKDSESL